MKKTILTFSILISSPIFNTFAVGGDNIIEIDSLSIEKLLEIAKDMSKSEREQFNACKELLNFPENTTEEILLDIAYHISTLVKCAQDKNIKLEAIDVFYNKVIPKLFAIVQNTQNEKVKHNAISKLWSQDNVAYRNESVLLDLAENANDKSIKSEAVKPLWSDHVTKLLHFNILDILHLNFLSNGLIEKIFGRLKTVFTSWLNISQSNVNLPLSIEDPLAIAKNFQKSEKERFLACKKLMTSQDVNKDEVVFILFAMAIEFTHYNLNALDVLWKDQETKEKHLDVLTQLYFYYAKNTKSEITKISIFNKFFKDQQCKIKYTDELVALALDLAENTVGTIYAQESLNQLWKDQETKEKYHLTLFKALLVCAQQDSDKISKSNAMYELWYDQPTREAYRGELVEAYLDLS
ncbi:MAG: hypothetical protein Q8L85_00785, partial [Alphaproteobacteria bacterium]|nr:hypothetical protein [Alphaproteobacteria bacterium]